MYGRTPVDWSMRKAKRYTEDDPPPAGNFYTPEPPPFAPNFETPPPNEEGKAEQSRSPQPASLQQRFVEYYEAQDGELGKVVRLLAKDKAITLASLEGIVDDPAGMWGNRILKEFATGTGSKLTIRPELIELANAARTSLGLFEETASPSPGLFAEPSPTPSEHTPRLIDDIQPLVHLASVPEEDREVTP